MGHDVIMTPGEWLYFDHYQCDPKVYPVAFGGYTPLSKTYGYNPVPQELAQSKHHYIQGVQANIWTEYMYNEDQVENRIYPRILALSEIAWSALAKKDYPDFLRRLDNQRVRLDMHDINYYIPIAEQDSVPSCDFIAFTHDATLKFKTTEPVKIVYTTDGSEPVMESAEYKDSLLFEVNTTLKLRSILASGKMGDIRTITLERQKYAPATEKTNVVNKGLKAEYYKGLARKVSDIDQSNPIETEYVSVPENIKYQVHRYDEPTQDDYYSTVLTGYINIPENDVYYFSSLADEVWIDDKLLISNEGEVKRNARNDKSIALAKGYHKIKMVRLSATFGGMPPLWYGASISIRASGDKDFEVMDESYFK